MISLYFIGEYFKMAFNNRQIWLLYILGHIFGVVLSICVNVLVFDGHNLALGASCGVSTLVAGLCLTYPNLPVYIYFIKSNLKWLLILFAANSVFMLFTPNMIGGMGHLFSMVFGLIYVKFLYKFVK
jgi:membrane associated rhomboid family serine protease